ncbi:DNA recombination/repair protein RecA [Clostridia bacterium]|nr:DNA recombination/repair protein RecA [Clostridia bacterium]
MAKKEGPKKHLNIIDEGSETAKVDKEKALKAAMSQIEKQFGTGAVMYLGGEHSKKMNIEAIPTGSLTLDLALGIGGLPKGRIIEIYGAESGGKTTVSLHCVAEVQKRGGTAAFIDVEHALDPVYAKTLGVNIDELLVSQPDTGEQALEIIEMLVRSGAVDLVVLDSVAAMVTKAEIEGNMGDTHVGLQARLMSAAMRKLTSIISRTNSVAIFINQVREKIGAYGNPETTPGGRALKFYASVRIEVHKAGGDPIKDGNDIIGVRTKCKVVKNKVSPPFKTAEFDMIFGKGISKVGEIIDLAAELDIVRKSGAWYYYGEDRLGQGRENAKQYLLDSPEVCDDIETKVRAEVAKVELLDIGKITPDEDVSETSEESEISGAAKDVKAAKRGSKKNIVVEVEDDFEEFSADEL